MLNIVEIKNRLVALRANLSVHPESGPDTEFEGRISDIDNILMSLDNTLEVSRIEGVLTGLDICKKMWSNGTISHENIFENITFYKEELASLTR